mmetsp:Transcript_605/g.1624  ORF Transcript_605/g.1624 Transcript_605/m.1624 type:complete len:92 (-) Transcript_605:655-930(-)
MCVIGEAEAEAAAASALVAVDRDGDGRESATRAPSKYDFGSGSAMGGADAARRAGSNAHKGGSAGFASLAMDRSLAVRLASSRAMATCSGV